MLFPRVMLPAVLAVGLVASSVGAEPAPGAPRRAPPSPAPAPQAEQQEAQREAAARHFHAGLALQKVEDFDAAIREYEQSLRLFPTKGALFNLANCQRALHRYADALTSLERLKAEHEAALEPEMRAAMQAQLGELATLTASVLVVVVEASPKPVIDDYVESLSRSSNEAPAPASRRARPAPSAGEAEGQKQLDGAFIFIDGVLVAEAPMTEPLRLDLGAHQLEVRHEGYQPAKLEISLTSGQRAEPRVRLSPLRAAQPAGPEPQRTQPAPAGAALEDRVTREQESDPSGTLGWVSAGAGLVLLAGAGVTGLLARDLDRDLSRRCPDGSCPRDAAGDLSRLDDLALTTDLLLVLGAAGVVTGTALLLSVDDPAGAAKLVPGKLQMGVAPGWIAAGWSERF